MGELGAFVSITIRVNVTIKPIPMPRITHVARGSTYVQRAARSWKPCRTLYTVGCDSKYRQAAAHNLTSSPTNIKFRPLQDADYEDDEADGAEGDGDGADDDGNSGGDDDERDDNDNDGDGSNDDDDGDSEDNDSDDDDSDDDDSDDNEDDNAASRARLRLSSRRDGWRRRSRRSGSRAPWRAERRQRQRRRWL